MLGTLIEWTALDGLLPALAPPHRRRTALASGFSASLELAREGGIELRQERPFAPLWLRRHAAGEGAQP
jgi:segregation and condensation protein A